MAGKAQAQVPQLSPTSFTHPTSLSKRGYEIQDEAPSPAEDFSRKRNRTTVNSSRGPRGVANLTPGQRARKRANDREAQRAIRERTKNQIENLERRIRELTSQQPYQELQHVLRQKEQVEAENADIKNRLGQIIELIKPISGHNRTTDLPAYTPPYSYMPNRPSSSCLNASTPSSATSPGTVQWQPPAAQTSAGDTQCLSMQSHFQQLVKQRHDMTHNFDIGPERLGLGFLLDGRQHLRTDSNSSLGPPHQSRVSDRNSSINHKANSILTSNLPFYSIPVRNSSPTCPLDTVLLEFLQERRSLLANNFNSPTQHLGPAYPSVASLLNPSLAPTSHPLSKLMTDIIATFPDISTLPEKIAIVYTMFIYMRWAIHPTSENHDRLPSWMRPLVSQITTPHPAWVDYIPWPAMRDRIVRDYSPREYGFDHFFIPFTMTVSVGWPYEDVDCLIREGEEVCINPVFERHLRRLENWSLGEAFEKAFPGLEGTFRLVREKGRKESS